MPYTDAELERLLGDLESDLVERKASWKGEAAEKARQAVCAFANDLPDHRRPGILFVGASDDGTPAGLRITDELLRTLADMKSDGRILPPPTLTVERRILSGAEIAVVAVQPSDSPPVRFDGRIWVRTGPRRAIASAQDERILNEKRRYRDIPFDVQPLPAASLADLSQVLFLQEYLPRAFAPDILAANDRTLEQRLAACRMIAAVDNPVPTIMGMLVLGTAPRQWVPGAYIQFLRIAGTQYADDVVDEIAIDGPVGQMIARIDDKLDSHNRVAVDIRSEPTEQRSSLYPRAALQQLVRNAVMHRAYEHTNAPVRVSWFDDRIEIISPGGPFGSVTAENFGSPGVSDYRNPNLAEAIKVMGFVQRFGVGIQIARDELKRNGNPPPEFEVQSTTVKATVRRRE